jgi:starch synthase
MNILFAVSEIEGVIKTGGLADVARALPKALNELDKDARVAFPYYNAVQKVLPVSQANKSYSFNLKLGKEYQVKVHSFKHQDIPLYTFDIVGLFDRDGIYGDSYQAYEDNGERYSVFNLAILYFWQHFSEQIRFTPDIIHCNDWHTALLPFYLRQDEYWQHQNVHTVLSVHNGAFQGIFSLESVPSLLVKTNGHHPHFEHDLVNFLKLGILNASKVIAVSPNYANELLTELGSHHLYDIFIQCRDKVTGILNGCDYSDWNPKKDPLIEHNYDANTLSEKLNNKLALQKHYGLPVDPSIPMFGQVSRLTDQKGLNYLIPALKELMQHNIQVVIAGTGDPVYVDQLEFLAKKYPTKFKFIHGYSEEISHRFMASADFFLMPSLFEPCGLTQMYALAYGTLPIVREVGGLKDTVNDLNHPDATGLIFKEPSCKDMVAIIRRALLFYIEYPEQFNQVQKAGMRTKFLWQSSAKQYIEQYETML